jgi:ketosteroid isomerase-like protein
MTSLISQGKGVPQMTPLHEANHAVKVRFVDALFANDWETMAGLVHPDFELREPDALPYGGIYRGIEGFQKCWELIPQSSHKTEHLDTLRTFFSEDPESIIVELDFRGSRRDTGEKFGSKVMEQFDFRDGLIVAITIYWFNIPDFRSE